MYMAVRILFLTRCKAPSLHRVWKIVVTNESWLLFLFDSWIYICMDLHAFLIHGFVEPLGCASASGRGPAGRGSAPVVDPPLSWIRLDRVVDLLGRGSSPRLRIHPWSWIRSWSWIRPVVDPRLYEHGAAPLSICDSEQNLHHHMKIVKKSKIPKLIP